MKCEGHGIVPYFCSGPACVLSEEITHDDWCLLGVDDLGPYHDPRYSEKGDGMSAWELHDHGTAVLAKVHALLGFGDEKVCLLCDERYDRIRG